MRLDPSDFPTIKKLYHVQNKINIQSMRGNVSDDDNNDNDNSYHL